MSLNQRPPVPSARAGTSKPLASAGSGAISASSAYPLPPCLTGEALSSLRRLPLPTDCTVKWERYESRRSKNGSDTSALCEALFELNDAENRVGPIKTTALTSEALALFSSTLWSVEIPDTETQRGNAMQQEALSPTSLWIFTISLTDFEQESTAVADSETLRQINSRKDNVQQLLERLHGSRQQGSCQLRDFYPQVDVHDTSQVASLMPKSEYAQALTQFLAALQGYYLTKWIMTEIDDGNVQTDAAKGEPLSSQRATGKDETPTIERDDEEEGAIDDARVVGTPGMQPNMSYWTKGQRAMRWNRIRLGSRIVLRPPIRKLLLLDKPDQEDDPVACLTLRCLLNDKGYIFVERRPDATHSLLQVGQQMDVRDHAALLAPNGLHALLIERLPRSLLGKAQDSKDPSEDQTRITESKGHFFKMLHNRGIEIDQLEDDWIVCSSNGCPQFLWPAQLCFAIKADEDSAISGINSSPSILADKPLLDIAARAAEIVKESIGAGGAVPDEDTIMLESEGSCAGSERSDDFEGGQEAGQGAVDDTPHQREDEMMASSPSQDVTKDGSEAMKFPQSGIDEGRENHNIAGTNAAADISSHEQSNQNSISRDDDEADLWGTFGFGPQDVDRKDDSRRQSLVGIDDGGFGLITEDDFSFFDEAAKSADPFDDMDVDVDINTTAHGPFDGATGQLAAHPADNDSSSEMAMTSCTFVDPPSLPGFTPGSLSATSPAVGGLNAKTPRTPFSPSQDLADAQVAIEGNDELELQNSRHYHDQRRLTLEFEGQYPSAHHLHRGDEALLKDKERAWAPQSRGDLMSKYEQGKYALPPSSQHAKRSDKYGMEEGRREKDASYLPRSRLRHRTQRTRRSSASHSLQSTGGLVRKMRNAGLSLRSEEEMSDLDATIDGTLSDGSSAVEIDSEEEGSVSSDGTSEVEETALRETADMLSSSIERLQKWWPPFEPVGIKDGTPASISSLDEEISEERLAYIVHTIVGNPHLSRASNKPTFEDSTMISRSQARELFTDPFDQESTNKGTLTSLLSLSPGLSAENPTSIEVLESSRVVIGCQGSIVAMESTALPYWEKLGLGPVSGLKRVAVLALHSDHLPSTWQTDLLAWLAALSSTFMKMGLGEQVLVEEGTLRLGNSHSSSLAQILVQTVQVAEQWTDTLDSLLSRMHGDLMQGRFVVIYSVGMHLHPNLWWIFHKLETDLRQLAWQQWKTPADLINVRGVAWTTIAASMRGIGSAYSDMRRLALSIYDSLAIPTKIQYNAKDHLPIVPSAPAGILHPCFTLPPVTTATPRLERHFHLDREAVGFNLLDAGLLLHAAYHVAARPGELSCVAIMDEKAQGYHVHAWRRKSDLRSELQLVWKEVESHAGRACILWRVIVYKFGQIGSQEVEHWVNLLHKPSFAHRILDTTLACVDTLTPFALALPLQNRSSYLSSSATLPAGDNRAPDERNALYLDAHQANYAIYLPFRVAMLPPPGGNCITTTTTQSLLPLKSSVVVSMTSQHNGEIAANAFSASASPSTSRHFWLHLLHIANTRKELTQDFPRLHDRIELITRSLHQLTFIAKERFLRDDGLPWPFSILNAICHAQHLY